MSESKSFRKCAAARYKILMYPVGNYKLKVNDRNTRTRCEIFSKLTIKTPE